MAQLLHAEFFILQICEFLDFGDGVYRFHTPSQALSRLPGVVVADIDLHHRLMPGLAEVADVLVLTGFDWDMFPLLERRRAAGRISVFEANDYYYDIQSWNPLSARWLDRSIQDSFHQGMTVADAVQTSTPELARRWRMRTSRPICAFPNQLTDIPPLTPPTERPLTIGWGGSPGHFADWYHLAPTLEKWLLAHPNVHLAVMNNEYARPFFRLPAERYRFVPFGSLADYLRFLRGLDIGLAPLLPSDYNRCRSDVKFLEYASQGVAGIYADLEPYRDSVVDGETGLIYRNEEELLGCLDQLVRDADLRQKIRQQAHAYVSSQRRLEQHIGKRHDFYRSLLPRGPQGYTLPAEVVAAAARDGDYLQFRRQQPEELLLSVTGKATTREAVQSLAPIAEQHPHYVSALQHLGRMFNDLKDYRTALHYLERARPLNPSSARTLCEMGRSFYLLNDDARAKKILQEALTINPYFQQGWQYYLRLLTLTKTKDAAHWAARAHELHPANFALALLGIKLYPPAEAVGILHRWLDEYAPTFMAEEMPAAAAAFSETIRDATASLIDSPEVLALLRSGVEVFPSSVMLANLLACSLRAAGLHDESHEQFARALALKRAAQTYQNEYPKDDGIFHFGQFAEHIREVTGRKNS